MVENLVPDYADHLEGLLGGHRVDQHVAMDAYEMLRILDTIFILRNGEVQSQYQT